MDLESKIRKLAKHNYWQRLYSLFKDGNHIQLFLNKDNFSGLQILMFSWLEIYYIINKELSQKEWENLDEKVINDDIRLDAFLYWRNKEQEKELYKIKQEEKEYKRNKNKSNKGNLKSYSVYKGKS